MFSTISQRTQILNISPYFLFMSRISSSKGLKHLVEPNFKNIAGINKNQLQSTQHNHRIEHHLDHHHHLSLEPDPDHLGEEIPWQRPLLLFHTAPARCSDVHLAIVVLICVILHMAIVNHEDHMVMDYDGDKESLEKTVFFGTIVPKF